MAAPRLRALETLATRHRGAGAFSVAALLLLVSAPAWARPSVTVADFEDATRVKGRADKVRSAIVKAVQEADDVDLIPYSKVKALAASRRIKTVDLVKPKVLGKVLQAAGADAGVTASIVKAGAQVRLQVRIYDQQGAEIWEKAVPLQAGDLPAKTAQRFAAAISAAVGVVGGADRPTPAKPPPAETDGDGQPAGGESGKAPAAEPKVAGPNDEPEMPLTGALPEPSRKPRAAKTAEPEAAQTEQPSGSATEEDLARPGWVSLSADLTFTWRNYNYCPEVKNCEDPTPSTAGMSPVKYSTGAPYAGVLLHLDVFPLRFLDNFMRGVGLSFGYGTSLGLKTHYTEDSVDQVFDSRQQRISAEIFYRFYFRIGGVGDGWAGIRGGWMHWAFYVDPNPKIVESVRSGLFGMLDLGMPLHRFLRIEAKALIVPLFGPGEVEKLKYGGGDEENQRPSQGGGWVVEGGLASDLGHPEWHIGLQAMFEYSFFGDRYNNPPDVHPEFGRATESYVGFRVGLRTQF